MYIDPQNEMEMIKDIDTLDEHILEIKICSPNGTLQSETNKQLRRQLELTDVFIDEKDKDKTLVTSTIIEHRKK